ncbi:MAG: maleylpyruvate isomerase N-terminal domain-containing protein, partial [Actinomycetes bacterium]
MEFSTALVEESRRLGETLRTADPDAPVPTCPGWTLRQLLAHVGRGHRWAATIVRERSTEPIDPRTVADGKPPADPDTAVAWLADGATVLLDAVATDRDVPVWT